MAAASANPLQPRLWRPPAGQDQSVSCLLLPQRSPSLNFRGAGIFNLPSIACANWPQLRNRLTLGGRTFPRKPWAYGGLGSNQAYRYSCLHSHLLELHTRLRDCFDAPATLSYQRPTTNRGALQSFGILLIANHFRRRNTR